MHFLAFVKRPNSFTAERDHSSSLQSICIMLLFSFLPKESHAGNTDTAHANVKTGLNISQVVEIHELYIINNRRKKDNWPFR